ncbi:hypothetical protein I302_104648 [Kwoniella bestiolae CBS 10118]|uniref:Cupin type-2 domain-containing protein n=1 Tax=Kwoniella bestiolae CBS 10118 TaxID=1296100 RepID=A0A1B9GBV5_9TREE|nr:hypothetical protein I302_03358 [Kwoniella bestiolae CBS 10118]OCF28499.1 hypothetical protein I302_03358 [Kwoniella bestiolae CBS 10118]
MTVAILKQPNSIKVGPTQPPPAYSINVEDDSQDKLLGDIPLINVKPLWKQMSVLVPPRPKPRAIAHKWEYKAVRPHLVRAGQLVSEHEAERRVLMLINPTMDSPYTTDTLYAGLQLVLPGETAPAHRHTAFAVRFIVEGNGGFTAVHGERIKMSRGDFILTPYWCWHDHGNDGVADPMIWLDGLDLPQYQHFPVHFAQHYSEPRYPAGDAPISPILFPWSDMECKLQAISEDHAVVRYTSKISGKEGQDVSNRLGAQCERVNAGIYTKPFRETSSAVYHVIDGVGKSVIGDKVIEWVKGDTFAVPSWEQYHHHAAEQSFLFRFDDKPMLQLLGFYRSSDEDFFNAV